MALRPRIAGLLSIVVLLLGTAPVPPPPPPPGWRLPAWDHLCDDAAVCPDNGAVDEAFTWTHPAVQFDATGAPQCDATCLEELWASYEASADRPWTIDIPVTRFYGATVSAADGHLVPQVISNVLQSENVRLGILAWDLPGEDLIVTLNGQQLEHTAGIFRAGWDYQYLEIPVAHVLFPTGPGAPSNPLDPTAGPQPPPAEDNHLVVTLPAEERGLLAGIRLVIPGVRPVVLVPGFGGDANGYCWGLDSHSDPSQCDYGSFYAELNQRGVILEKPCHYRWSLEIDHWDLFPLPHPVLGWFKRVYDYQYDAWYAAEVSQGRYPDATAFNPRCFEASDRLRDWTGTLATNAAALKAAIQEVKGRYGVNRVNLVGHSKGGLFSRAYAAANQADALYANDVESVISISTPHMGAYLMDLALDTKSLPGDWATRLDCSRFSWICRLPHNTLETAVNLVLGIIGFNSFTQQGREISIAYLAEDASAWNAGHRPAPGVRYYSILATGGEDQAVSNLDRGLYGTMNDLADPLGTFSFAYQLHYVYPDETGTSRGQGDIGIAAPSQRMGRIGFGFETAEKGCWWIRANHEQSSRAGVAGRAVALALGLPQVEPTGITACDPACTAGSADPSCGPVTPGAVQAVQPALAPAPAYQPLWFSGSVLTAALPLTLSVPVDGADFTMLGSWEGGQVDLTLTGPQGARVTPATALADPDMAYTAIPGIDSAMAQYVITTPLAGAWAAHLAAPASGDAGRIDWGLLVLQRSPISFTLAVSPAAALVETPVTLRGEVFSATNLLPGANVRTRFSGPRGISATLALWDDGLHSDLEAGDGVYGNQWLAPEAGSYIVSAEVTGTLPSGVPYLRQARSMVQVLPSSAHFAGVDADTGVDADGDGLFEKLRIPVRVVLAKGGRYGVSAILVAPGGMELGAVAAAGSGVAGEGLTLNLEFGAAVLLGRAGDGPFLLRDLTLLDQASGLRADYQPGPYTTASYRRLDFAGPEVQPAGTLSDRGVDADGTALFDALEVSLPLVVRRAGAYTATAVLETLAGDPLVAALTAFSAASDGVTLTVPLSFDGGLIYLRGADGPYRLANLRVEGPLGLAWLVHSAGETSAYAARDFDAGRQRLYLPVLLRRG